MHITMPLPRQCCWLVNLFPTCVCVCIFCIQSLYPRICCPQFYFGWLIRCPRESNTHTSTGHSPINFIFIIRPKMTFYFVAIFVGTVARPNFNRQFHYDETRSFRKWRERNKKLWFSQFVTQLHGFSLVHPLLPISFNHLVNKMFGSLSKIILYVDYRCLFINIGWLILTRWCRWDTPAGLFCQNPAGNLC